jgi:hypothetical protein
MAIELSVRQAVDGRARSMTIRLVPSGPNLRRLILAMAAGLLPLVPVGAPAQSASMLSGVPPPATGDALAAADLQLQSAPPSAPEVVTTKPPNDRTASAPRAAAGKPAPPAGLGTAQISELQTDLGELGYTSLGPDGLLDGDTIEAFNLWRRETDRSLVKSIGLREYNEFKQEIDH